MQLCGNIAHERVCPPSLLNPKVPFKLVLTPSDESPMATRVNLPRLSSVCLFHSLSGLIVLF